MNTNSEVRTASARAFSKACSRTGTVARRKTPRLFGLSKVEAMIVRDTRGREANQVPGRWFPVTSSQMATAATTPAAASQPRTNQRSASAFQLSRLATARKARKPKATAKAARRAAIWLRRPKDAEECPDGPDASELTGSRPCIGCASTGVSGVTPARLKRLPRRQCGTGRT